MQMNWSAYIGKNLVVTLKEYYGLKVDTINEYAFYEITNKNGILIEAYDDGLLLENKVEDSSVKIYIPLTSIKCVEII